MPGKLVSRLRGNDENRCSHCIPEFIAAIFLRVGDLNLSRLCFGRVWQEDFQDAVRQLGRDSIVVDVVAQDERSKIVAFVIFLMDESCSFGGDLRNAAEQCQPVVLNLQFQSFQGNARQVRSQNQTVVCFVNIDRWREHVSLDRLR
jgi:hypothetical protein